MVSPASMPSDDSKRLRAVYAAALQRDPEERDEYLNGACAGDLELRARVAALLEAHSKDFLETEGGPSLPRTVAVTPGPNQGTVIGPYIVRRELGRGGMGVVYLVDDTRLSRPVALKALTPEVGRDPRRRERLRLEARAAAALSHPGIATVYALDEIGDDIYLAYEYVPGEPLRALITAGSLPIGQVVTIGAQLARALAAAHTAGVIHRDIKPENVMKTPSGVVKILDFGLARVEGVTSPKLTQSGVIVGTPAYMAPEQVLGQPVDFRTDLFAFGVLIYELATGVNPFVANTVSGTLSRIVENEPSVPSQLRPQVPPELDQIVTTCLRKDPADRYASTQDLVADLEQLESELAVLRRRDSSRSRHETATRLRQPHSVAWWWEVHQVIVSLIYLLMIYPAWYVQRWLPPPWGMLFLLVVLASAAAGVSLRLHSRFIARHSPGELHTQLWRNRLWTRVCDVAFASSQVLGALGIGTAHPEFAMLFVAAATAMMVAALVIEPATERTAFGNRSVGPVIRPAARLSDESLDALLDPHRAWIEGRAALETFESTQIVRARDAFERVLRSVPDQASAHVGLANACIMQFEMTRVDESPDVAALESAVRHSREACRLEPEYGEAWATLGFVLERTGAHTDALAASRRAVALEPDDWRHHLRLASIGWGEERLREARRTLALLPGFPLAHWLSATVLVARHALGEAERELDAGIASHIAEAGAPVRFSGVALHWLRGLLYLARGEEAQALAAFERELNAEASGHLYARECCANTWYAIGASRLRKGQGVDAEAAFQHALERVPGHALARLGLALINGASLDALRSGATAPPFEASMVRAVQLAWTGRPIDAASVIGQALAVAPPGNAGWLLPVEPLLRVNDAPTVWASPLARLATRAA